MDCTKGIALKDKSVLSSLISLTNTILGEARLQTYDSALLSKTFWTNEYKRTYDYESSISLIDIGLDTGFRATVVKPLSSWQSSVDEAAMHLSSCLTLTAGEVKLSTS